MKDDRKLIKKVLKPHFETIESNMQTLMNRIRSLEQDLENERQRADELSDKLDRLYEGSHESDRIISKDEYNNYARMVEILNTLIDLQDDIREDMNDESNRGDVSEYVKNKIREFINMELN